MGKVKTKKVKKTSVSKSRERSTAAHNKGSMPISQGQSSVTFKDLTYATQCSPLAGTEPFKQNNTKDNRSSNGNNPSN